ncbi:lipopolysaccharide biosynthesis protein [Vibrio sp. HN007]|uniref:lipopolysaccharide biosynthesis protein n=1 Tax=Vibrio iocasae TaxID=3098914 RepID=UPI0035D4E22C
MSNYFKNIARLLTGNVIAQLIAFLGSIVIPLYYTPEQVGELGIIVSVISILSIIITLRLDTYLLAVNNRVLKPAVKYVIQVILIQSIILSCILLLCGDYINNQLSYTFSYGEYVFMLICAILTSITFVYNSLLCRLEKFNKVAAANVIRSIVLSLCQVLFGIFSILKGLWYPQFLSRIFQVFYLVRKENVFDGLNTEKYDKGTFLRESKPFVTFTFLSSLVVTLSTYIPVILIPQNLSVQDSGIYFFTIQIIITPVSMIVQSISKVFSVEFIKHSSTNSIRLFYKTFLSLLILGGLYYFASIPIIKHFSFLVPIEWRSILDIADLVVLYSVAILAVSSVSQVFNLVNGQKLLFISECIKLALVLFVFYNIDSSTVNLRNITIDITRAAFVGYTIQFVLMLVCLRRYRG